MKLTSREETLNYRFLPVSETEVSDEKSQVLQTKRAGKTKIAYGFLFQLAGTTQITLDQIETCHDDPIHINQISARKVAVYRYSGVWSELRYKRMLKRFLTELRKNRVETTGEPFFSPSDRANQFWSRRRNEIWLEVAR